MTRIVETPDRRTIAVSDGTHTLAMMRVDGYVAPSWPEQGQGQMHFDISVTHLDRATARALSIGRGRLPISPPRTCGGCSSIPPGTPAD